MLARLPGPIDLVIGIEGSLATVIGNDLSALTIGTHPGLSKKEVMLL
jgi:hypothetical protein